MDPAFVHYTARYATVENERTNNEDYGYRLAIMKMTALTGSRRRRVITSPCDGNLNLRRIGLSIFKDNINFRAEGITIQFNINDTQRYTPTPTRCPATPRFITDLSRDPFSGFRPAITSHSRRAR